MTGGAGFIGLHLCEALLRQRHTVTCYDSLAPQLVNPHAAQELEGRTGFRLVPGDVLDLAALQRAFTDHDVVIHAAAIASVDRSIRSPVDAIDTNARGTLYVLEAARRCGIERVHYVSTDEVYGHTEAGTFDERSPSRPRNPYAAGKAGGEAVLHAYGASYGLKVTITNACNTYGPRQALDRLIPRLIVRAILGKSLPVYGDGQHIREWLHVDDHVAAILEVLDKGAPGGTYCVGSGERVSNLSIAQQIAEHVGLGQDGIELVEDRRGHDRRYAVDSSRLQELGWRPEQGFDAGLIETVKWYLDNRIWWEHFVRTVGGNV